MASVRRGGRGDIDRGARGLLALQAIPVRSVSVIILVGPVSASRIRVSLIVTVRPIVTIGAVLGVRHTVPSRVAVKPKTAGGGGGGGGGGGSTSPSGTTIPTASQIVDGAGN